MSSMKAHLSYAVLDSGIYFKKLIMIRAFFIEGSINQHYSDCFISGYINENISAHQIRKSKEIITKGKYM